MELYIYTYVSVVRHTYISCASYFYIMNKIFILLESLYSCLDEADGVKDGELDWSIDWLIDWV